ncbi:molybdopterin-dependent oxidoreductase [Herbaspirillum hiltneri N3]|uniref:Molybdopterin-dependent oxidoreductase n=1 Tax=Herbaspirillum hiltneri N3 TaxID=1262470 RepID=A0ABM5V4I4_9BURK|nr:molybdopterin-dependent oxidoreductase [Herbaspirillum hiltneri]AKZ64511.1 molybdopterin-dependent oxidoreductase [Herbaspirillum hiltneri N3]
MKKRQFLAAGLLGMSATAMAANKKSIACSAAQDAGPVLLTLTGAIGAGNRGALDPALDQMMAKQKLQFNRAHTFDFASLSALPQTTIKPTLEYDNRQHVLSGPLLADVAHAAGASAARDVLLRAVDGYAVQVALADIRKYRFIVATHLDGKPIPLGGLGPLWAVYDADSFPDIMEKPISARFALCPWGMYHIEAKT